MDSDLAEILDGAWQLLARGAADRRSPVHTPVVASVAADGCPQARVMVLRRADRAAGTLRFHTDTRSTKVTELDGRAVAVLGYHPGAAVQLRLTGTARVVTEGTEVDRIWTTSTPFARRCYLVENAPGTPLAAPGSGLPEWVEGGKPTEMQLVPARANFALVMIAIAAIDWLHLAQTGHRRAVFTAEDGWAGQWVVP